MPVVTIATPRLVGGGEDLAVADRAAGLDDRAHARLDRERRDRRRRGRRRRRRAPSRPAIDARLLAGQANRVDAAHLPGADADAWRGRARPRSRWSARACRPSRRTAGPPIRPRSAPSASSDRHLLARGRPRRHAPARAGRRRPGAPRAQSRAGAAVALLQQAHVLARLQDLERVGVVAGREEDLDELLVEHLGELAVDARVEHDDAAVGASGSQASARW